jgi:hypothetical protein
MLDGRGVMCGLTPQFGIYDNILLSACFFENGEIVVVCKHWDLNSVDFQVNDGKIRTYEAHYDYFEFRKCLDLTEGTSTKGSRDFRDQTLYRRDKKNGGVKGCER